MPKLEIQFHKSMIKDKRNTEFAYLIDGIADVGTPGLYPSHDFVQERPDDLGSSESIIDILGSDDEDIKVIVESGSNVKFYNLGSDSESNTSGAYDVNAVANGIDGVYILDDNTDKIFRVNYVNSNISETGTFPSSNRADIGIFDGLYYWWIGTRMWRQLPDEDPELIMSNTGFGDIKFVVPYLNYLVFFTQGEPGEYENIIIYFFNKEDSTFFSKRIETPLSRVLGAGMIDGQLTMFTSVPKRGNNKEIFSELVASAWNGETFTYLNSIKGGRNIADVPAGAIAGTSCRSCDEYMLVAVDDNDDVTKNPDLYQNYIYKVYKDGSIQVLTIPNEGAGRNYASIVNIFRQFDLYAVRNSGGVEAKIYTNDTDSDAFDNYRNFAEPKTYITNFYTNPYNYHKLNGINIAFEKLFRNNALDPTHETGEKLEVYYRTSDRLDWTLLGEVSDVLVEENVNKRIDMSDDIPIPEQRYQFAKITTGDDLESLPEFNEIQFKFVSYNGFSIIGAWMEYDYLTRNTLN